VSKLQPKPGRPTRDLAVDHEPLVRLVTKPDSRCRGPPRFPLCRDDQNHASPPDTGTRRAHTNTAVGGHAARAMTLASRAPHRRIAPETTPCVRRLTLINGRLEALRRNALGFRNMVNYRIRSLLHSGNLAL
jgi:hypothetical protein